MIFEPVIEIKNLSKRYDDIQALKDINLDIMPGKIIGLIGANGSGKSTLLRHMIGLYLPDTGSCRTFGFEARNLDPKTLARIGYVHQDGELLDWMTVYQLIDYVSAHYPNWNLELQDDFLWKFEIDKSRKVGKLSPGEYQKLAILLAICFEPELLIFDEPASDMDPLHRADFLELLLKLIQDSGRTIIISSHILSDIQKIVDHILALDKGRLIKDTGFDTLQEEYCRLKITSVNGPLPEQLPFRNILNTDRDGKEAIITIRTDSSEVNGFIEETDWLCQRLPLSLEDIYRYIINEHRLAKL